MLQYVAVRCSALQCVAVRCSALQCIAVRCSALQCAAVRCSVVRCGLLQFVSSDRRGEQTLSPTLFCHCNTLHHAVLVTATHYTTLQRAASLSYVLLQRGVLCNVAVTKEDSRQRVQQTCCSVLQRGVVCCSVLQCVAVRCSALQCCIMLLCVEFSCIMLQCVAVWCSVL